ncbi:MAG: hypothetical protein A3I68_08005 [Candidatus Melainabacteria bacterium RIFCSPLOWO2_02_FULL_35_15]|nr:MAG: hypothetical protein A3F80_02525 [Candidatus Melainabacteria bacterium RIFCSPLOWO2_12_FULL_35_11]OGI14231.1 MAG: hypothetical protein A3I68_08005 [Candidatus Melainabacteria bacterium RIFCSPLOWO2_02_FULL_35_15]
MPIKSRKKNKDQAGSYAYSRETVPFPESDSKKVKPPSAEAGLSESSNLFVQRELSQEEKAIEYMSTYKKFERVIVCNFYTGGGVYTRGILDSIYRGFNPLNP